MRNPFDAFAAERKRRIAGSHTNTPTWDDFLVGTYFRYARNGGTMAWVVLGCHAAVVLQRYASSGCQCRHADRSNEFPDNVLTWDQWLFHYGVPLWRSTTLLFQDLIAGSSMETTTLRFEDVQADTAAALAPALDMLGEGGRGGGAWCRSCPHDFPS